MLPTLLQEKKLLGKNTSFNLHCSSSDEAPLIPSTQAALPESQITAYPSPPAWGQMCILCKRNKSTLYWKMFEIINTNCKLKNVTYAVNNSWLGAAETVCFGKRETQMAASKSTVFNAELQKFWLVGRCSFSLTPDFSFLSSLTCFCCISFSNSLWSLSTSWSLAVNLWRTDALLNCTIHTIS